MIQLDRSLRRLGESAPTPKEDEYTQMWRNVATEMYLRRINPSKKPILVRVLLVFLFLVVVSPAIRGVLVLWLTRSTVEPTWVMNDYLHTYANSWLEKDGILESSLTASNGDLRLYIHSSGTKLWVENVRTGQIWPSNHGIQNEVALIGEEPIFNLSYTDLSQGTNHLILPFKDITAINFYPFNSGIGIQFGFAEHRLSIQMNLYVGTDYIEVEIPSNGVRALGDVQIDKIALQPFLASFVDVVDSGYIKDQIDESPSSFFVLPPLGMINEYECDLLAMVLEGEDYATFHTNSDEGLTSLTRAYVEFDLNQGKERLKGIPESGLRVRYYLPLDDQSILGKKGQILKGAFTPERQVDEYRILLPEIIPFRLI